MVDDVGLDDSLDRVDDDVVASTNVAKQEPKAPKRHRKREPPCSMVDDPRVKFTVALNNCATL